MMRYQQTLREPVQVVGHGLHSGEPVQVSILPAPEESGISFRRVDADPAVEIPAHSRFVTDTAYATVLGRGGLCVSTVEHCLAALQGMGIDNAVVELDGPELPILDGSALPYVTAIRTAGVAGQEAPRRFLQIRKPVRVESGEKFCLLRPASRARVSYTVDFEGRLPESQHFVLDLTPGTFATELAPARTFGFLEDVKILRALGKAKGGTLDNALVLDAGRVLNPEGFRMPAELVRHKILDALGDLSLTGFPILGHMVVYRGGHALHHAMVRALLALPDAWSVVEADPESIAVDYGDYTAPMTIALPA